MLASGTSLTGGLGDAVFLAITVAFFGLAWLLVRACERIGGTEEVLDAGADLGVPIGAEVSTGGGAAQDTGGRRDPSGERTGRTGVVAATALVGGRR